MNKSFIFSNSNISILLGFSIWVLALFNKIPYSIFELTHVETLLIAAPLWLIPLVWSIAKKPVWLIWLSLCCGILFTISYQLPKGIVAGVFIFPWLLLSIILAFQSCLKSHNSFSQKPNFILPQFTETAGYLYLPVGIFWAIIDRLDMTLLDYSPTIILLTAVHFHYAGFILPQVTSWLIKNNNSFLSKIVSIGIILGIPLVAIGISATHFNWPGWVEVTSVTIMTVAGGGVGMLYMRLGWKTKNLLSRTCFFLGGLALITGMSLAFCYGWRHVFVIETLTIPWMYAVHGTCNAVGFAGPVLIGWKLLKT